MSSPETGFLARGQWLTRSIGTRLTLATLLIIALLLGSLSVYASRLLREDMLQTLGEQQFATVSAIAENIDYQLAERLRGLELVAATAAGSLGDDLAGIESFLLARPLLRELFSAGLFAYGANAELLVEVVRAGQPNGQAALAAEDLRAVLQGAGTVTSRPLRIDESGVPMVAMTVPIRNISGRVVGALSGSINLEQQNLLQSFVGTAMAASGGQIFLASAEHRLVITSSNPASVMTPLPPPGVHAQVDRFVAGFEGGMIATTAAGVEVMAAVKALPSVGWALALSWPTAQVLAPIEVLERRLLWGAVILALLAAVLVGLMVRQQLLPLTSAARAVTGLSSNDAPPQPLPVVRQDEVGTLITAVNKLLQSLAQRDAALRESEFRWQFALEGAGHGVWDWDVASGTLHLSHAWKAMRGYADDEVGNGLDEWESRLHPDEKAAVLEQLNEHMENRKPYYLSEHRVRCKDGSYRWFLDRGLVVSRGEDGKPLRVIGTNTDITERQQAALELRRQQENLRLHNDELERFNRAMVGRELDMIRLKRLINELSLQLGQPEPYPGITDENATRP